MGASRFADPRTVNARSDAFRIEGVESWSRRSNTCVVSSPGNEANAPTAAGPKVRAGFRFEKLSVKTEGMLQRFVQRAEVDRLRRRK